MWEVDPATQVFAVRLQLEPFAATEAARQRRQDDVARLEATLGAMADAVDDPQPSATRDARLHAVIARASRNPVLFDLLDRLAGLAALSRSITSVDDAVRRHTLDEARELVAAIRDRDPARAESAMREHLHLVRASAQPLSAAPSRRRRPAQRR